MTKSNIKHNEDWSVEKLKSLTGMEVLELFKTLSPPPFEELNGEYASTLLGEASEFGDWLMYKTELGHWLGKAYTPTPTAERPGFRSEGYNFWKISFVFSLFSGKINFFCDSEKLLIRFKEHPIKRKEVR